MTQPQTALQSADKLATLLEITRSLMAEIDLDHLLQLIVSRTSQLLDAERNTLYLVDPERGELWSKIYSELEIREIRLRLDGPGLAAYAGRTGETVNLADAYDDPRFDRTWDILTGYRTRSMLVLPMRSHRHEVIGVFQALNKRSGIFDREDEDVLGALAASAAVAIENAQLYAEQKRFFDSLIETLAATVDARDQETGGHTQRVTRFSVILARAVGLSPDQVEAVRIAAVLHDYGKIAISDVILTKPGRLTDEEVRAIRQHSRYTYEILSRIHFPRGLEHVPRVAGQHHEFYDGSGTPWGLAGEAIALGARIIAVADVLDALLSKRYYKPGLPLPQVAEVIRRERGRQFDPAVVDAFERALPELAAEWARLCADGEAAGAPLGDASATTARGAAGEPADGAAGRPGPA